MTRIIAALLLIFFMLLFATCEKNTYDLKPYSVSRNIDSAYLDTLYNDTL